METSVSFPTVSPGVLAGFSLTRYGAFRAKDVNKLTKLLNLSKEKIPVEFLDYAKVLRQSYPKLFTATLFRDLVQYFSGGYLANGELARLKSFLKFRRGSSTPNEVTTLKEII